MKSRLILMAFIVIGLSLWVGYKFKLLERLSNFLNQPLLGKNWQNEVEKQKYLYTGKKQIVFIGDSHIEQCEWQEVFPQFLIGNRGIGGETSDGLLSRLDQAVLPNTSIVVLQIGVNDILSGNKPDLLDKNYENILKILKNKGCRTLVTLPFMTRYYPEKNKEISNSLKSIMAICKRENILAIDLNPILAPKGELLDSYTIDGVHLNSKGYKLWIDKLNPLFLKNLKLGSPSK